MNYYSQSSFDFLYLPKGPKVDREKLEETQFNSKILNQNNIKHLYQKQLNDDILSNNSGVSSLLKYIPNVIFSSSLENS